VKYSVFRICGVCLLLIAAPTRSLCAQNRPIELSPVSGDTVAALRDALEFAGAAFAANAITNIFGRNIVTFPTASSSAGFTYTFDPQLGLAVRDSKSFGSLFVERARIAGQNKWAATVNFQHTKWQSIDGVSLLNSGMRSSSQLPDFDQTSSVSLDVTTSELVFGITGGINSRMEIGLSTTVIDLDVMGQGNMSVACAPAQCMVPISGSIGELAVDRGTTAITRSFRGHTRGLGDSVARLKVSLRQAPKNQIALLGSVRLPTGDADRLLGTGRVEPGIALLAGLFSSTASIHARTSYVYTGNSYETLDRLQIGSLLTYEPSQVRAGSEFGYAGGLDVALTNRVTASADFMGRALFHDANVGQGSVGLSGDPFITLPVATPKNKNVATGVIGVKANIAGQWLLLANVLFPLTNAGLKPGITPVLGIERAF
jgi:hypothetical protein